MVKINQEDPGQEAQVIRIVTINILNDLSHWKERRRLLADELAALKPDLVALQEVNIPSNPAAWLAEQIGLPYLHLTTKTGFESSSEGIAILSRYPFESQADLSLGGQQRVAQMVRVSTGQKVLTLANGHFFWQPGESAIRLRQVERFINWLNEASGNTPLVICGDFNGTPETQAIQLMSQLFTSAYAAVHRHEPEYTCPTPLPRSFWSQARTILGFFFLIRPKHFNLRWRGVLDYIFVDQGLKVFDCQVVLNKPSPDNSRIYPSDHFGLYAQIGWDEKSDITRGLG